MLTRFQSRRSPQAVLAALWTLLGLLLATAACAQQIPRPTDREYPGVLTLTVDASNVAQQIFQVRESLPVHPGPLTLLYPEWLLGTHAPAGVLLAQFAGLELSAGGRRVEWQRDPVNPYAFHVMVPAGATTLEAGFQFLSPTDHAQGAIVATPEIVALHWEALFVYPAGYYARRIMIEPTLVLPAGWAAAGALEAVSHDDSHWHYRPVNLEDLVDSPIYAGRHVSRIDLDPGAKTPVYLDLFADNDAALAGSEAQIQAHRALVQQAYRLFGGRHYGHYDFLMALSDEFSFSGLEHHQSSENGLRTTYFPEWNQGQSWRSNLVSHEYVHSWDGKFRRPADQLTANFNEPMRDSLLWVYEGLTSYWGHVLAARSGLVETSQMQEGLAATAALYDHREGRRWRNLADTTNEPIISHRRPLGWISWQRSEDYYSEGELIWVDADTLIRSLSGDRRSLDDFAVAFFGVEDGRREPLTYTFDDVVHTLNAVQPYDWATFLRTRVEGHGPGAPLDGLARAGWRLVYDEKPTAYTRDLDAYRKVADYTYSLGLTVDRDGRLTDIAWEGPAFRAGLTVGYTLLAVDGRAYKPELLAAAITAAKGGGEPIELLLRKDDRYVTRRIAYHDGLRYPRLERLEGTRDRLQDIYRAR